MSSNIPKRKCWICGKPATEFPTMPVPVLRFDGIKSKPIYKPAFRGYCAECASGYKDAHKQDTREYIRLKKKLMVERAIRCLERQKLDIYEYKDAIEAVSEWVSENPEKMDSSDEVIAAIILIDNEINVKVQERVGKYHVDFLLPELKVALEIDGITHADSLYYDKERDKKIRQILGDDWEVVRIKTEYVESNADLLVEAIKRIKVEKQAIRSQCGGEIPEWFSGRAKRPKKKRYGDDSLLN